MNTNQLLFLSAADVRRALPMREAVDAMKYAFATLSAHDAVVPPRSHLTMPKHKGNLLLMPCYLPSSDALSLKAITLFDGNPARGLPRIHALVTLFDGTTGQPLAIMDGASLTALRTGAGSGAATDLLSRRDASSAAILGAGAQGRTQLEAVCCVRSIQRIWAYDANPQAAEAYAREMSKTTGLNIVPTSSAAEAVRQADIICTATSTSSPIFADADLKTGAHINAVGSYHPTVQEIPTETVLRSRVVVDHLESALLEAGDLLVPIHQGLFSADRIHAELGEIVNGIKSGRADGNEITLFKSVGVAIQDLVAASRVLANARQMNLGTLLHL